MTEAELKQGTKQFALRVIRLVSALPRSAEGRCIGNQLIRSGTSVGTNYRSACRGRSRADFIAKLGVVEEEADESCYWLELVIDGKLLTKQLVQPLLKEAGELTAIFTASLKSLKSSPKQTENPKSKIQNPKSKIVTKYLVTGGAGFIGSHIVERLVKQGDAVRVLDNLSTGSLDNLAHVSGGFEFIEADLQDDLRVAQAVRGVDVVIHQAALASVPRSIAHPVETHHACVTGTVVLLDQCRQWGVKRIVYAASSSAYGNQPVMPKTESQLPQPLSPYAAAKLAAELYLEAFAASYGLETVRLRYFNVFGPRQDPNSPYSAVIPLFVTAVVNGRQPTIYGDGSQSRDFTFVENVVSANLLAAHAPAEVVSGKVYNVACGGSLSLLELLKEICDYLDKPFEPCFAPPRIGDVLHSWADISAAQRDLGYRVEIDLRTGLRRTIDDYVARTQRENHGSPQPCGK